MLRALSTAATGMEAEQTRLDVTANNIANVATNGFKKGRAEFEDLLYQVQRTPGQSSSKGSASPVGVEIGMGVRTAGTTRNHEQGELKQTGNDTDMAIEGDGFFAVELPNGSRAYTRDGAFTTNAESQLVTREGYRVAGDIQIPQDAKKIDVAADGTVTAFGDGYPAGTEIGRIPVVAFVNVNGLSAMGHNLYQETAASGTAMVGWAGENGTGAIRQRELEQSNVKIVEEMIDLIAGQRAYEVNSRVIKAGDEMLAETAQLR